MDDFDRDVYCLAGLPFDAVDIPNALTILTVAARNHTRCFLSTPNLNFLIASRNDTEFRNSVIHSDLVVADGVPLVWLAKLLRIPVQVRVAGSSLFEAMHGLDSDKPISVYLFGGPDGVAEIAAHNINQANDGLTCVGYQSPGFVSVEEMSTASRIDEINASNADFLVVSLGAKKGQSFIYNNLSRIKVPIISHLGAVVNFEAKVVKRAPVFMQNLGMEWLWRIKEEPGLWRRYWHDGLGLLHILSSTILPYALWLRFNHRGLLASRNKNSVHFESEGASCRLQIAGIILDPVSAETRSQMRKVSKHTGEVILDLTDAEYLSPGFFALLLLLKKHLDINGAQLRVIGVQRKIQKLMKWNGLLDLVKQMR
jgi:N-acetylglucosaminyldiphosphoundecaprenol N-acetyl-beta-D-mannosaminyltransferase